MSDKPKTPQPRIDPEAPCHICIQNGAALEIVKGPDDKGNYLLKPVKGQRWPGLAPMKLWFTSKGEHYSRLRDWTVRPGTQAEFDAAVAQ